MPDAKTIRELRKMDNDSATLVAEFVQKLMDEGNDRTFIDESMNELIGAASYVKSYCAQ